ncbi:sensor histidine kinase [Niallia sp. BSM11]|uniref:sensor histidine kinase n=1 Tax=Niallia sp. BSM11 TaxID=3391576 RepID=UPI003985141A
MKLFLRSHLPLLLVTLLQGVFIFFYYWFLGFQDKAHLLYVFMIQILSIVFYLLYRWVQDVRVYRWLKEDQSNVLNVPYLGKGELSEALYERHNKITQAYNNQIQHVQADLEERVTFINQWVHQMKTPLSVIHLMIQDNDEELFQSIRKEVYRLEDGLKTVLYSSRLSMFEKDYTIETILLQDFLNEIIIDNKRLFIQNKIVPKKQIPDNNLYVVTDKKWLHFAIGQIISNAVKYSTNKSDTIHFLVGKQDENIILEIRDFGIEFLLKI